MKSPGSVGEHKTYEFDSKRQTQPSQRKRKHIPTDDMLNAIECGEELKDQSRFETSAFKTLRFFYPQDWEQRRQRILSGGRQLPKRTAMRIGRVRMDVAAMIYQRTLARDLNFFRFVSLDASPQLQRSYEAFITAERTVARESVSGKTFEQISACCCCTRILPVATLGQGKTALSDKVASHIHQTWCDYGPSRASVRNACSSVRQVLTDMGVEFGVANYPDVIDECINKFSSDVDTPRTGSFLYPFALQVPGLLHILDWVVRESVESLPFWPAWQAKVKRILQYTHGKNHRDLMQKIICTLTLDSERASVLAASIDISTGRFAKWCWKALQGAVKELQKVEIT